jgi:hypothetical protein
MVYHPDDQTSTVISTLILNGVVSFIIYCFFEVVRGKKEIFAPRLRTKPERTPNFPNTTPFSWITAVNSISDEATLQMIGLDAFILLRFVRFCCKFCCICGLIGICFLFPVYFTSEGHQNTIAGINLYTMGNIEPGGDRLWVSVICCWIFTLLFLYLIHSEYEEFAILRRQFLYHGDKDISLQMNYSVYLENIPNNINTQNTLYGIFNNLFVNEINNINLLLSYNINELDDLINKRYIILNELEQSIAYYKFKKERKLVKIKNEKSTLLCGEDVDAIDFYTSELSKINNKITILKENILNSNNDKYIVKDSTERGVSLHEVGSKGLNASLLANDDDYRELPSDTPTSNNKTNTNILSLSENTNNAFITFKTRSAQAICCQMNILFELYDIYVTPATNPDNIIWNNIYISRHICKHGETVVKIIFTSGILFWGTVIAFIAAISNLSTLEKYLPFVGHLNPTVYSLLAGILPVIIMNIFLGLLPTIFEFGSVSVERRKTKSSVQLEVLEW